MGFIWVMMVVIGYPPHRSSDIAPTCAIWIRKPNEIKRINQVIEKVLPIGEDPAALWELLQSERYPFCVYRRARGDHFSQALKKASYLKSGINKMAPGCLKP